MSEPNTTVPAQGTPQAAQVQAEKGQAGEVTKPGAEPAGAANSGGKPSENQPKVVPEKYDLKPPKDSPLESEDVERIASYAKEQGLSQDEASKLLEREHNALAAYADRQKQRYEETKSAWMEATKADKELGGDNLPKVAEVAKRVIDRYGSQAFKDALNETGLGNHPELVRVFYRIGKMMADDTTILGNQSETPKQSAAELLYGGSK